ncbi:adenylyl cyclase-associated protein-like [Schistocerca gregaria]|uniref:adenylyl cyclase-associated protein-like n=1 Tax=Schistocerca gregaria TaxID=7010 RepID=UPI00211E9F65|nr:adenylyl cyclase-associated protein-like [Schistocerca gregaria]
MSTDSLKNVVERLESVASKLEKIEHGVSNLSLAGVVGSQDPSDIHDVAPSITAFDEIVKQNLKKYYEVSEKIGGLVRDQSKLFEQLVTEHRNLILIASKSKKSPESLPDISRKQIELTVKIVKMTADNRSSPFFTHLSAVSEGLGAFGWVSVEPAPAPFVHEMIGASEFYSNKLLRQYRNKDQDQVDWVQGLNGFLKALEAYVKTYHTTSLTWNAQGEDVKTVLSKLKMSCPSSQGEATDKGEAKPSVPKSSVASNTNALFGELNKGTDITSGLKKVTSDMKTKNRKASASDNLPKPKSTPAGGKAPSMKSPPKFELQNNNWIIEYQTGDAKIDVDITEMRQVVRLYKCDGATVRIKGKLNAINIDSCRRTDIIFDEVVSIVELINCTGSVNIQVLGKVPCITIDKVSGASVILSKTSLDTRIVTSKSDSVNVMVPDNENSLKEFPVPEQFVSTIRDGALFTESNTHIGE